MFREKLTNFQEKRGYLYIRESIYVRDKRTLKRKPSKLCDGTATKERGKYSKKRDIYCGKIYEIDIKNLIPFREYVENILKKEYLEFKLNTKFDDLVDMFIKYLLYTYDINNEDFYSQKKKVYHIGKGYLSKETISWLKRFIIKSNFESSKEMGRFTYRCEDVGIYDEEIINTLYIKLLPLQSREELKKELELIEKKNQVENFKSYRDFMKNNK